MQREGLKILIQHARADQKFTGKILFSNIPKSDNCSFFTSTDTCFVLTGLISVAQKN